MRRRQPLPKFKGNRPLEEIQANPAVEDWDQRQYDLGSDWLRFTFVSRRGGRYGILYNVCSGRFMTSVGGRRITEASVAAERHAWYRELLDALYEK